MGKIEKGIKCSVIGCEKLAVQSVSKAKLKGVNLGNIQFRGTTHQRVYLCEEHYKIIKKKLKKVRKLDKMRYSLFK